MMPNDPPSPYDAKGKLKPEAMNNILVALLLRLGGTVELTWEALGRTDGLGFEQACNDRGLVFVVDGHEKHVGHC